jgi:predicted amidohydrolase YtcJ
VTLLAGGRVRTGFRPDDRPAEALGIAADGTVAVVGTEQEVRAAACPEARVVDLRGGTALPGLVDAHGHVAGLGRTMEQVDLHGAASAEEAARRAAERAASSGSPDAWVLGRGWDQNGWPDAAFPDRSTLDAVLPDRPVLLTRVDGHAAWANSEALRRAGIDAATPDPPGGAVLRREDGEPTGVLVDNAIDLVGARIPEPGPEERRAAIERAVQALASAGLTAVHDMGVSAGDLAAYEQIAQEGPLPLRIAVYLDGTQPLPAGVTAGSLGPLLDVTGVKTFADGALGSRGALLLEDYADQPGHRGLAVTTTERMVDVGREAAARSLAIAIHAIGDAGIRNAIDAIELLREGGAVAGRARVEHVQVLSPADLPRLAPLGIVASMQPVHATSDMPWAEARVGPERIRLAYAWRSVQDAGATLAFGTDFPVEAFDPLATLWAAVTRRTGEGEPAGGWYPQECVGVAEALLAMTEGAARALGAETVRGRLEPGFQADVTVLDRDPLDVPIDDLRLLRPRMTIVDGAVRWAAEPE